MVTLSKQQYRLYKFIKENGRINENRIKEYMLKHKSFFEVNENTVDEEIDYLIATKTNKEEGETAIIFLKNDNETYDYEITKYGRRLIDEYRVVVANSDRALFLSALSLGVAISAFIVSLCAIL